MSPTSFKCATFEGSFPFRWRSRKLEEIFDNQADESRSLFRECENGIFFNIWVGNNLSNPWQETCWRCNWTFVEVTFFLFLFWRSFGNFWIKVWGCLETTILSTKQYCWSKKEPNEGSYFVSCYITWGRTRNKAAFSGHSLGFRASCKIAGWMASLISQIPRFCYSWISFFLWVKRMDLVWGMTRRVCAMSIWVP